MTTLVLVRHAQASFGTHNYDQLSDVGMRQSRVLGAHWARLNTRWDACYSGEMQRQQDTARIALEQMEPGRAHALKPCLNEYRANEVIRAYLPWVAQRHPEFALEPGQLITDRRRFQQFFEKVIDAWTRGEPHGHPDLEPWPAFLERVLGGLRELVTPGGKERVVLFTSGGVITAALQKALSLDATTAFQMNWRIYNASQHVFRWGSRGLALVGFNNVTPLELERDAALLTFR